jgi:hypothetical protein
MRKKRFLIFSSQMNVKLFLILWFHFRTIKINRIKKNEEFPAAKKRELLIIRVQQRFRRRRVKSALAARLKRR